MMADNLRLSLNRHAQTLERISSGKRINSAKDDPAGLSLATKMSASIRTADVFEKNLQNALSFLQVQDGVLTQMGETLERMAELKALSDDVTKSSVDVALYQTEYVELQESLESLKGESFNGIALFSSSSGEEPLSLLKGDSGAVLQISRLVVDNLFMGNVINVAGEPEYELIDDKRYTWQQAKTDAEFRGGHLATVGTAEEWDLIRPLVSGATKGWTWLGGTDERVEGTFEWVDGTPWDFEFWNPFSPNTDDRDYVFAPNNAFGHWIPIRESGVGLAYGYIFEKDPLSIRDVDQSDIALSLQNIAQARAINGTEQNQLQIASALNATNKQNREAALSAIQDTDIARASADLSKSKIFIEAGTALLAMQNVNSKSVLRLLE
jgi:flagellin